MYCVWNHGKFSCHCLFSWNSRHHWKSAMIYMASTTTCCTCLNMGAFLPSQTTSFWVTKWIKWNSPLRPSVSFLLSKFSPSWKPEVCLYQQNIRILRWMQISLKYQAVQYVHRLFQLFAVRRHCGWENILLSWWTPPWPTEHRTNQENQVAHRWSWQRTSMWSPLVWPWQGHNGLGWKWWWHIFHVHHRSCSQILAQTWFWPH